MPTLRKTPDTTPPVIPSSLDKQAYTHKMIGLSLREAILQLEADGFQSDCVPDENDTLVFKSVFRNTTIDSADGWVKLEGYLLHLRLDGRNHIREVFAFSDTELEVIDPVNAIGLAPHF
jgi:hypothetical protein